MPLQTQDPSKFQTPYAARITGTGSAFPKKLVTNDDLAAMLAKKGIETNDKWIRERTGILERRHSDPSNPQDRNSAISAEAARRALEMAGRKAEDIELIVYGTCTPDTMVPGASSHLQAQIGAKNATAMDLNAACSGFVYSLSIAEQYIFTGSIKTALVVGTDITSTIVDMEDRSTCILFGDGGGAAVVERTDKDSPHRILSTNMHSDGTLWELLYIPAGGSNREVTPDVFEQRLHKMQMKGKDIFKHATKTLAMFAQKALDSQGMTPKDLDWFIPHQANLRIIDAVAKRLDLPQDKVLINLERFGNTSAGTVPTVLDEAVRQGKIKSGDTVLLDVFGAGLTFGSCLIRW